jgi:hypothetical protein
MRSLPDYFVSKSDALGESDLIIVYQSARSARFALLIDKVDVSSSPPTLRLRPRRLRSARLAQEAERDRDAAA